MTIVKDPDTILRQEFVDREQLAVAMLDRYYAALHFLAYSILGDDASADDAVQETIIRSLDQIDSYRIGSNMKAWLSAIVVNQCRNMLRRRKARQRLTGGLRLLFGSKPPQKSSEDRTLSKEARQDLWAAVDQLSDKHRLPIILRYIHNYSVREISQLGGNIEPFVHPVVLKAFAQPMAD